MTALLSRDGKNFTLACDSCGQLVANLAPTMGTWDVAWSLFSQDGWRGADLATGPHACGRCDDPVDDRGMIEQAFGRQSGLPAGRALRRVMVQHLPDVTIIQVAGSLDLVVHAGLRELLRTGVAPDRHLLFDLSAVPGADSATFAVLIDAHRRAVSHSARVGVAGARPAVREAVRMLSLHRVLPMFDDRRDALRWLRGETRAAARGRAPKVWLTDAADRGAASYPASTSGW